MKQILIDTKKTQLQQIKENEMRREAERELNSMWYDLMVKEQQAKVRLVKSYPNSHSCSFRLKAKCKPC